MNANPSQITRATVAEQWIVNLNLGYNYIQLTSPVRVPKGSIIALNTNGHLGRILINLSDSVLQTDLSILSAGLNSIDVYQKKHFLVNCLIQSEFYETYISFTNKYPSLTLYSIKVRYPIDRYIPQISRSITITNSNTIISTVLLYVKCILNGFFIKEIFSIYCVIFTTRKKL